MLHRTILLVSIFAVAAAILPAAARAQDSGAAMPNTAYGTGASNYAPPASIPIRQPAAAANSDTVTIPIPGGGEIQAPDASPPPEPPASNLPGNQWGVQQPNPYSHDIGPRGP